jgi:hypothetical protein
MYLSSQATGEAAIKRIMVPGQTRQKKKKKFKDPTSMKTSWA